MPEAPTPGPSRESDAELARIAADGQRRREEARTKEGELATERESDNIRIAIGSRGMSPLRKALVAVTAIGVLMAIVPTLIDGVPGQLGVQIVGVFLLIGGLTVGSIAGRGRASDADVEAERAWAKSLPFSLTGYFDVLGVDPHERTRLVATLEWKDAASVPRVETLRDVAAVHDTGAHVEAHAATSIVVRSSPIPTQTDVRVSKTRWVHDNTKFVPYVHGLVDRVLSPVQRSHPIAKVTLTRE